MRTNWVVTLLLAGVAGLTACSREAAQPSAPGSTAPPAQSAAAPPTSTAAPIPSGTVLASGQYAADPDLRCDLLEVKRVSGGALLIKWRIVNTVGTDQSTGLVAGSQPKSIHYDFNWDELFYIDPAENKKYGYLTDAEGKKILDMWWGHLAAGQQRLMWAKFPAPPTTSTKISVSIPKFAPFEDVPVAP